MSIVSGLFSLPFFSRSQMNSKEKSLILRACVSVACADGDMSTGEIETLKSSAADFGGFHAGDIDPGPWIGPPLAPQIAPRLT